MTSPHPIDPLDAPPVPSFVRQVRAVSPADLDGTFPDVDDVPARAPLHVLQVREVEPVAPPSTSDDWLIVAFGLGVACSALTVLLMVFAGA